MSQEITPFSIHRVWNYFQDDERNTKTKCLLCNKEYNLPLNQSTAKNHISFKHPEEWSFIKTKTWKKNRSKNIINKEINDNNDNDNLEIQSNCSSNSNYIEYTCKDVKMILPDGTKIESKFMNIKRNFE